MKKCRVCEIEKTIEDFEVCGGGRKTNRCKLCKNKASKEYRIKKSLDSDYLRKERKRAREKYHRLNYNDKPVNKNTTRLAVKKWREKYPEKTEAHVKSRKLKAKIQGNHLHHWSYNEEHFKDVIELSVHGHNQVHRFTIYDQERKMYRVASDGLLLDTRLKCVNYYQALGVKVFK